jgi:hypothetical protein
MTKMLILVIFILKLSDNDVSDSEVYQPPAAKQSRFINGKGKCSNNITSRSRNNKTATVADDSESDSDSNEIMNSSAAPIADNMGWDQVGQDVSIGSSLFRSAVSGVQAPLSEHSTPLYCLLTLLTTDIIDSLVENINLYVADKIKKNTPMTKKSTWSEWQPLTRGDFFRFLSVTISMGITVKHNIKDYWTTAQHKFTLWFKVMFPRTKFLLIYQSMLHASEPNAQGQAKIEPFVNNLVVQYQSAFYPFEKLSVDKMVIDMRNNTTHPSLTNTV